MVLLVTALGGACARTRHIDPRPVLDRHAAEYVGLVASLAARNPASVDFLIGLPEGVAPSAASLDDVAVRSRRLADRLRDVHPSDAASVNRVRSLRAQLEAVAVRADQLRGKPTSFDAQLGSLLDPSIIPDGVARLDDVRARLGRLLPGSGSLSARLAEYERQFTVGRGQLAAVVTGAVNACRAQTVRYLSLPPGESLDVEYVANRPWSGYSVYRGRYRSVMQVNRALPMSIGQILTLACHESYPGHHVYNVLRDQHLVRGRGWLELTALPLFSPEGFRAEAVAAAAAAMTFTHDERIAVMRDQLFPLAGFDPGQAGRYVEALRLVEQLAITMMPIIRGYLTGSMTVAEAASRLQRDAAMEHPTATLAFVDTYGAYSLAYILGPELVRPVLGATSPDERWNQLAQLIASPSASSASFWHP